MNKEPNEAHDFLKQLAKSSQAGDSYEPKKIHLRENKEQVPCLGRNTF